MPFFLHRAIKKNHLHLNQANEVATEWACRSSSSKVPDEYMDFLI